jgi:hypothetical protein
VPVRNDHRLAKATLDGHQVALTFGGDLGERRVPGFDHVWWPRGIGSTWTVSTRSSRPAP